jgi:hypothetical protein
MRIRLSGLFLIGLVFVSVTSAAAAAAADGRSFVQGFGGIRVENESTTDSVAGGVIGGSLTSTVQVVGEAGRVSNIIPSTVDNFIGLSPIGFGVSAWYGAAGVRFTSPQSIGVRPYVETSAGMARLHGRLTGLGSGAGPLIGSAALGFLDRTDPIASVGGGLTFERAAYLIDVGYRYRRIFSNDWIDALALGGTLHTSEARVGIGMKF